MNAEVTAGIDVSAKTLDATVLRADGRRKRRKFDNDWQGHEQLVAWLITHGVTKVVCEATGVYHLDVAYALSEAGMPLMVANPRQIKRFIEARSRNTQSDLIDADEMAEFARRMDFVPWQAPSANAFALHKIGRAIGQYTKRHTAVANRLYAAKSTSKTPKAVVKSIEREAKFIDKERALLASEAAEIVAADAELSRKFELLISVPGIAEVSATAILAELIVMPADLAGQAWVKYAGLDPRGKQSGTSVATATQISKRGNARLRGALYMPAMTARHRDPQMRQFAERLIANHKQPMEAIVAVQRKLLLSIHAMFRTNQTWNPSIAPKTA